MIINESKIMNEDKSSDNDNLLKILPSSIKAKKFYAIIKTSGINLDDCIKLLKNDGWKDVTPRRIRYSGRAFLSKNNTLIKVWCGESATSTSITVTDTTELNKYN